MTTTRAAAPSDGPSARTIVRIVLIVVLSALAVYLVYVRRTVGAWVIVAASSPHAPLGP